MSRGPVLAAGTYDLEAHPRMRVLIEGLKARGYPVEEIVEPLRLNTAERVEVLRHPSRLPRLARALSQSWLRLGPRLARRRRRAPRPSAVVVGHLGHFDVSLIRSLTRPVPVVLDYLISGAGTATDRGERGSVKQIVLRGLDTWALRHADLVLVDTQEHLDALPERFRDRAMVVPVSADRRWFDAGERRTPSVEDAPLSVVFFGLFTPLQGAPVIARALRELDGLVQATVIGTGQEESEVEALLASVPGVRRLTWVPGDDLPDLVAGHDVCLGVFGLGDKASRVVPNKAYQGAAAGCVVVTSDTAPQRRAFGEHAVFVPPGDPVALAAVLRELAADRNHVHEIAARSVEHARESFSAAGAVEPLTTWMERA